ncbi:MAG: GntR family transcriptional regulator [Tetrasphaera sp.]|nr:GntR family transcriptional regulator [Tetrasphaera sp.]
MILDLDLGSPVPPYEQVRSQLATLIGSGQLPAGHRLPPIRQLASDLGLAPGTIGRVYRELEAAGLVASRVRTGTVVQARRTVPARVTREHLDNAARGYAATARRLGADLDAAVAALHAQWADLP